MNIFKKTIFTGFSPNLTLRDTLLAVSFLVLPWKWFFIRRGNNVSVVEREIEKYFNIKHCYTFDSGRSALYFILKALGVKSGDEVLVQAYTCMVVVNAIKWTGATPVYLDVNDDFNLSVADLEKKISARSKALLVQHTFGLACPMDQVMQIAKNNNIFVVEDCAHAFGAKYNGQFVGTFGDAAILSFGADKVISSVRGGAVITDNEEISKALKSYQDNLPLPRIGKTIQHLMHYPIFLKGRLFYSLYLGKLILGLAKKINLINKIIYKEEKMGEQVSFYPAKYAHSLARILLNQLKDADRINQHRKKIAEYYDGNLKNAKIVSPWLNKIKKEDCIYLRYPLLAEQARALRAYGKINGVILGDWYNSVIAPIDIDFSKTDYNAGSCPKAEQLAERSVNLPTDRHIDLKAAKRIVDLLNKF
ncbi:MAG: DegT/DnrJ/EryC1/StrS aminotransferase [Parcubacteria group bacterium GW2011_GWE2_39_37]|uniref:DegT/DnrJ/EryC1/StrS aminotransferase n=1 Tax=Candidatus Falkowbacteria bacterium GW2011_GWF2_39_8 TaxID=1618642 RepID=A0A0G0T1P3_9BACT|nr:MAG: DegT/DnrJ/EryC1/StrS aminotransferase [Parcubacteria group bacterium GW2011_GWE2_39_37]KKR31742.1 MAG: DegT/DnrJ/EryC1/StrS aminotransferase [Candidatus Falkowbacteria bacterium GW2011_GWF2_39_8]